MKLLKQVTEARERIAILECERTAIEAQRRSRAQIEDAIAAQIDTAAHSQQSLIVLQRLAAGQGVPILTVHAPNGLVDLLPVMVRLLGAEVVKNALLADIGQIPEGLDTFARAARLADIESESHELQIKEESLIREATLTGLDIPRRTDAGPSYVLAL